MAESEPFSYLARSRPIRGATLIALFLAWLIMFGFNPAATPPPWFDEGWSLSVARNWVELGQYGRLLNNQIISSFDMAKPLSVTGPIAVSFRLLGVGIWQGRLSGAFFTMGTLAVLYALARRLYGTRVASATLFIALLLPMHNELNPLFIGRQALSELPLMFFLLFGHLCFSRAVEQKRWLLPTTIFWGIALTAKVYALPFWVLAIAIPFALVVSRRQWQLASALGIASVGALVVFRMVVGIQQSLESGLALYGAPMVGVYDVAAFVLDLPIRLSALRVVGLFGLPSLLGLGYAIWDLKRRKFATVKTNDALRISLVTFASSYLIWYVSLSIDWERYLFPVVFLSSMFVALLLDDLTNHFNVKWMVNTVTGIFRQKCFTRQSAGVVLAGLMIVVALLFSSIVYLGLYAWRDQAVALQVAAFLNTNTPPDSLIETYDSELLFLLNRRYHYPPDQLQVELNRRAFLKQMVSIDYNPLDVNPDYLVTGPQTGQWQLYQPVLAAGAFRRIYALDRYEVYERIR